MPNISRSKGNQRIKFNQLIEYNMRNIFLEKPYIEYGGETISRPFSDKPNVSRSLDQESKVLYIVCFIQCQVECYWNILKLSYRALAFTLY